ncbi:peptidoglycan D,D-transpeptidase FtsI family protein [Sciscionella marina]|uniref:peptidoglycan D,D-transpeptidase FtsI family protein n=1 Tax=Sciscionella marina TaxID=508770 RepID=UPI0003819478|nr:penicillin-binding protein 2 [Sciscionella marina]
MNKSIRRVGMAMLVMVFLLLANATYVQVIKADEYRNDSRNQRTLLDEYSRPRGMILDSSGNVKIASAKATEDRYKYLRTYADGPTYAPVTGFYSMNYGSTGLERSQNTILNGTDDRLFVRRLSDLVTGRNPAGGNVQTTIDAKVQSALYHTLADRGYTGAAVAIKPSTGEVLGMVSTPSFDPSPFASHLTKDQTQAWQKDSTDKTQPMLNRALRDPLPPGSTFKLIDAAAALGSGKFNPDSKLTAESKITLPGTSTTLENYGGSHCGSGGDQVTMTEALARSCNTAFASLAGAVGKDALSAQAKKFGVGEKQDVSGISATQSTLGDIPSNAALYQTGIGQRDVQFTPLQSAEITAAIANKGVRMQPQLVKKILGSDLTSISDYDPQELGEATSPDVAAQIIGMMKQSEKMSHLSDGVTDKFDVASKTGTAEHGINSKATVPYGWYTAMAPANNPQIAVSVMVSNGSPYGQSTVGAKLGGPVGHAAIKAYLGGG